MINAINTKLLVVIIALLASIASYLGYEKHKQDAVSYTHLTLPTILRV